MRPCSEFESVQPSIMPQNIGLLTSGGDAQGMNSAIKIIVRKGILSGYKIYFIKEGYQGMVDGAENIVEATVADVFSIGSQGGTIIGTGRCKEFQTEEGQLKAARNLLQKDINHLIIIGGDGSLTGANNFSQNWPNLLKKLSQEGTLPQYKIETYSTLHIVGIVGSIDNDFCGTDLTIGADSALHRIQKTVDSIQSSVYSQYECFILVLMGRNCGYLSLITAVSSEADYLFIPEYPPSKNWKGKLCNKIAKKRESGINKSMIILSEGAIDREGKTISANDIKSTIVDNLGLKVLIQVLGYRQRSGPPSAVDRSMAYRMGMVSVITLMNHNGHHNRPKVATLRNEQVTFVDLNELIEMTHEASAAIANHQWAKALSMRGSYYLSIWNTYKEQSYFETKTQIDVKDTAVHGILRKAVCNIQCLKQCMAILVTNGEFQGINSVIRGVVRSAIYHGSKIFVVDDGYKGLLENNISEACWSDVNGISRMSGSVIGADNSAVLRGRKEQLQVLNNLLQHRINKLVVVGTLESISEIKNFYMNVPSLLTSLLENAAANEDYKLYVVGVCGSISGYYQEQIYAIGVDSAVNRFIEFIDTISSTAYSHRRCFVIDLIGPNITFLADQCCKASDVDIAFLPGCQISATWQQDMCDHLKQERSYGKRMNFVIVTEGAMDNEGLPITSTKVRSIIEDKLGWSTSYESIGHDLIYGPASPHDRTGGSTVGASAVAQLMALESNLIYMGSMTEDIPEGGNLRSNYTVVVSNERREAE